MLNTTILQLFISHSLGSPLLTPSGSMHISKSSFSFFSSNLLYSHYSTSIAHTKFLNFLSTAIKIINFDRKYNNEVINSRIEVKDDSLHIYFCLFSKCVGIAGGGGGAIFISGGTIEVNFTGFQSCHVSYDRSLGGAIYSDSNSVIFNGLCLDNCYASDYGQSIYLLDSESHLEFITITQCGIGSTSSFVSEVVSVSGTTSIRNLNSTGNSVKIHAAGICYTKTTSVCSLQIIYSSFVGDTGNSIIDVSSGADDTISFTNFVSNIPNRADATCALIFIYGLNTQPIFNQCYFKLNSFLKIADEKINHNSIRFVNCYSDTQNWGDATLSNCLITLAPTHNNPFYSEGICDGNFQIPVITPSSGITTSNSNEPIINSTIPEATVITSLYPLPTNTPQSTFNLVCPECQPKKKDVGKTVATAFSIIEAILIIILIISIVLLSLYVLDLEKKISHPEDQNDNNEEDGNQFTIDQDGEVDDLNANNNDNQEQNDDTKTKVAFVATPHMPSSDSSPSGARRRHHEQVLTPQVPRKKRRRLPPPQQQDQINERSPLIEERKKLRIVFSSSTDSDAE